MTVSRETIRTVTMGKRAAAAWDRKQILAELARLRTKKLDAPTVAAKVEIQRQIDLLLDNLNVASRE